MKIFLWNFFFKNIPWISLWFLFTLIGVKKVLRKSFIKTLLKLTWGFSTLIGVKRKVDESFFYEKRKTLLKLTLLSFDTHWNEEKSWSKCFMKNISWNSLWVLLTLIGVKKELSKIFIKNLLKLMLRSLDTHWSDKKSWWKFVYEKRKNSLEAYFEVSWYSME